MRTFCLAVLVLLLAGPLAGAGEGDADADGLALKTASTHPMKYYLSLPRDYRPGPGRRWPVLVCVDGSGSNSRIMGDIFRDARGSLPCLVVSPCTFSNTNEITGEILE